MDMTHSSAYVLDGFLAPSRCTGKERDTESGNDYFFARYYSSATGRFLSPDWAAKAEPVPYAKLDDPQTLNLYSYLRNNPLGGIDVDGHYAMPGTDGCNDGKGGVAPNCSERESKGNPKSAQQQATLNIQVIRSDNLTKVGQSAANAQISDLKKDMAKLGIAVNITSDSTLSSNAINHLKASNLDKGAFVYVFGTDQEVGYTSSSGWFTGRIPGAMINEAAQGSEAGVATHEMLHYLRGDNNTTNPRAWYRENSVEWARKRLDWGWAWGLGYLRDSAAHPPQ